MAGQAIEELDKFAPGTTNGKDAMLRLWALSATGRLREAEAVIRGMPESVRRLPPVAMTLAEMAAKRNDLDETVRNVRIASVESRMTSRTRALFPYLASHGQWVVIMATDSPTPHTDPETLRIAIVSALSLGDQERAASLLESHRRLWTSRPSFLGPLYLLAARHPHGYWTKEFATLFADCLPRLSAEELGGLFDIFFALKRADLAWLAYGRLKELDNTHPALTLVPARFADQWFIAGPRGMGPGGTVLPTLDQPVPAWIDVSPTLCGKVGNVVPLAREMLDRDRLARRREDWLQQSIMELERREKEGRLTPELANMYIETMESRGRISEVNRMLDTMNTLWPERRHEVLLRRAQVFEGQGDWDKLYEVVRQLREAGVPHTEKMDQMLVNALMHLDCGLYALEVARGLVERFPNSDASCLLLAYVWEAYGCHEDALGVMEGGTVHKPDVFLAQVLSETGRAQEASRIRESLRLPAIAAVRGIAIRSAESALEAPSGKNAPQVGNARAGGKTMTGGPLVQTRDRLTAEWSAADGANMCDRWAGSGRDPFEKAMLLHRLACLCAQSGNQVAARQVLEQACGYFPESIMLWRLSVSVSGGKAGTVEKARQHCPDDGEIWLAWLVVRIRGGMNDEQLGKEVDRVIAEGHYPSGYLVRAGDYLLRMGHVHAATALARCVLPSCKGLPAAYLLGMHCALATGDRNWAKRCAAKGLDQVPDEPAFLKITARLSMDGGVMDSLLVSQLSYLAVHCPSEREWRERLGKAYFDTGDWAASRQMLMPLVEANASNETAGIFILTAEACRRSGDLNWAIRILRNARERYPSNVNVFNNLVCTLASGEETMPEARALLPELLRSSQSASVFDTVAMVYRKEGDNAKAIEYANQALALLAADKSRSDYLEIALDTAEIDMAAGDRQDAAKALTGLGQVRSRNMDLDARANKLRRALNTTRTRE